MSDKLLLILLIFAPAISFRVDMKRMNKYLDNEESLLNSFDEYLSSEEQRISRLRQMYEHFRQQNTIAMKDKNLFLSHPNDVYLLIKRIVIEWKDVQNLMKSNNKDYNEIKRGIMKVNWNKFNFTDVVINYEKLIYFYESDIRSAADGYVTYETPSGEQKVFKSTSNQTLDSFDCYLIGKQSFEKDDYFAAREWLATALIRTNNNTENELKIKILKQLAITELQFEKYDLAIKLLNNSILIKPDQEITKILMHVLKNRPANFTFTTQAPESFNNKKTVNGYYLDKYNQEYQDRMDYLCLGKSYMNESLKSELKCYYLNTTSKPYLRLTRIRVEELYKRPQIVLFHNITTDKEIELFKNLSMPHLHSMTTVNPDGSPLVSDHRVAHGSFVYENRTNDNSITKIVQRISAITGLNTSDCSSDGFNVIQYNAGGLYELHHDSSDNTSNRAANRKATWITYLSDVEAGGATVLTNLNLTVFPLKYSAIFWYNYQRSGEIDEDLYHTGCPVLYGYKWIATRWIRFDNYKLIAECGLNYEDGYNLT